MNILSGDIGGTKTRLAIYESGRLAAPIVQALYPSGRYSSLTDICADFLANQVVEVEQAVFGVAGPVFGRSCKTTNLPWHVDADQIEQELNIPRVQLINDLVATAYGVMVLNEDDIHILQQGSKGASGNRAVIAAGTGLGEAGLYWSGEQYHPFATEGGHCNFAPNNDLEFKITQYLYRTLGHGCWEDLVSGPGLVIIHKFLCQHLGENPPGWLTGAEDPAAAIAARAEGGDDATAVQAMELFIKLYGAEAGNLALKHMATGGIYLGGGIAPKILDQLQRPGFLEAFCAKGKMRGLMEKIPVAVIMDEGVALHGAALCAARQSGLKN